ncbi:MAG: T9SS type A sorting domain-containing protein [Ignavibacteria bacterium]|jgi:hypothetical protein|nr:T9SS type A sorting domain-containing protein [Ignavibacteria bacterium]MDH7527551.1 T9SS type A sorting domain-containing protein [Ignavibacteria bacterium]
MKVLITFLTFFMVVNVNAQWVQTNGPYGGDVQYFTISGTNLFARNIGSGVWRRSLTVMITSIERYSNEFFEQFSIFRNYPNSFKPNTCIRYQVTVGQYGILSYNVLLKVYDVLGREVRTLIDENLQPGSYEVTFDGSGLASGVFVYRLNAADFTETKRMLLLR